MNKKSRIITILTCITGDAAFFYWIYFSFTKMERFKGLLAQALVMHQMTLNDVSESDLQQLFSVMVNSLITALIFFSLFHLVVYTMFYFEKKAAIKYVKFVSWMALLSSPFLALSTKGSLTLQIIFWVICLPYIWVIREFRKPALKT